MKPLPTVPIKPTYTPHPTHTPMPPRATATRPPLPTPTTPVSLRNIYVAAFGSCAGQYHGEQESGRQAAAIETLDGGLRSLEELRAIIDENCAGAIEATTAKMGITPSPTVTLSIPLTARQLPTPWQSPTEPSRQWTIPTVPAATPMPQRLRETPTPEHAFHDSGQKYPGGTPLKSSEIERLIIAYTNEERKKAGLPPFIHDSMISTIARNHSRNMAQTGQYSHKINGKDQTARALAAGYDCRAYRSDGSYSYGLAENIDQLQRVKKRTRVGQGPWQASKYSNQQQMAREHVQRWMDSPGHRKNILSPESKRIGVGVSVTIDEKYGYPSEKTWATQNFSRCK